MDSQQTKLIRWLAPHFEHRLFLSATPHNGYPESFTALLEIIDDQRFARGVDPDPVAQRETVIRRMKSQITDDDGQRRSSRSGDAQADPGRLPGHRARGARAAARSSPRCAAGGSRSQARPGVASTWSRCC